jgi:hypothetical protein
MPGGRFFPKDHVLSLNFATIVIPDIIILLSGFNPELWGKNAFDYTAVFPIWLSSQKEILIEFT